jgi:hypothetical protein
MPKVDAATKAMMDALKAAGVPQSTISKAFAKVKAESFLIESLKAREILDS